MDDILDTNGYMPPLGVKGLRLGLYNADYVLRAQSTNA